MWSLPVPLGHLTRGTFAAPSSFADQRNAWPLSSNLLAVAVIGLSSFVAVVVLTAAGGTHDAVGRAALHALVVGAPVATGLCAVRERRSERFGQLLIASGLLWSLAVLSESPSSVPYSIGRIVAWLIFPVLVYLMLAFPQGRLTTGRDRILFGAISAVIGVLYIGSALVVEAYPEYSPWTSCGTDCPPNAFLLLPSEPGFVEAVLIPARDVLSALLLAGVTASIALRMRESAAMRQVTTAPVLAVSMVATLVLLAFVVARGVAAGEALSEGLGLAWTLCLPAIAAAFSLGLVQRRLLMSHVLSGMSGALSASLEPQQIGAAVRSTTGDPTAEVLIRDREHDRWLHEDGREAGPSEVPEPRRVMREITDESGPLAAIVLDAGLDADDELTEAIVSLAEAALREARLRAELAESLDHLDDSRKRIATAAEVERRRIERDLHDGAQQRLIALRMKLSVAEDAVRQDSGAAAGAISSLGEDVDHALEEIRSLAHGIYPALLADRGLADALRSAARRSPLQVQVRAAGLTRHAPEIESAVYFTCLEALQNVAKHGGDATHAGIWLQQDGLLEFAVSDDGQGFDVAEVPEGAGLRNMRDRVESLGGTLAVRSSPGRGTTVCGTVPLPGPRR